MICIEGTVYQGIYYKLMDYIIWVIMFLVVHRWMNNRGEIAILDEN